MKTFDMNNQQLKQSEFRDLVCWKGVTRFTGIAHHNSEAEFSYTKDDKYSDVHLSIKTIWGNEINLTVADITYVIWAIFDLWQSGALRGN